MKTMAKEVPGESQYVVTCDLAIIRCGPDGHREHLYRHQPVPASADPNQVRHLLEQGMVRDTREATS